MHTLFENTVYKNHQARSFQIFKSGLIPNSFFFSNIFKLQKGMQELQRRVVECALVSRNYISCSSQHRAHTISRIL